MSEGTPLYFGCYREPGHRLWAPGMTGADIVDFDVPWEEPLGLLAPSRARLGEAELHHNDGWTAVAFWDRSVERQPGGHSVFLIPEDLDFDEAVARASEAFPEVWQQLTCVVRLPGGRRKLRNEYHPPPGWYVEEAFVARGPNDEAVYHPTKNDAVLGAWDHYQGKKPEETT